MEYFSGDFCLCTCVIKDPDSDSYKTIRNASIIQLSSEFINTVDMLRLIELVLHFKNTN